MAPLTVVSLITTVGAQQTLLFDNSSTDLAYRFNPGTFEVGDQIQLQSGGFLRSFSFEYYGTNTLSPNNSRFEGAVEARVRFYLNNGGAFNGEAAPGSIFYDSDWFTLAQPTPRNTIVFEAGTEFPEEGLFLSEIGLTWTVQFRGMAATDEVGIDIYSPPSVGRNWPDYWRRDPEMAWRLESNVAPMDFAARFQGVIPEPSGVSLLLLGGGFLLWRKQGRTSKND